MADEQRPLLQRLSEDGSSAITDLIYQKVNDLLGAGDQLFTMEFPARPLNGATYTYNTDNMYSSITKPISVQQAEFALSDALYDTVPIIQAGNGEKLSTVYSNVLNNFVPKIDFLEEFVTDKNHLRKWLLTEVEDSSPGEEEQTEKKTGKITRMSLCKKLYGQFLEERNKWNQEKNRIYNEYQKGNELEKYAQWVTTEAVVRDEQLSNLFNDAVVQGNYHEVMTILGFLNIQSPAEMLEKTKQNMRSGIKRSLDGSGDVYPVQFQPTDWFKALKPNLHPKDLTMSQEALFAEYRAKQASLRRLEQSLSEIGDNDVSSERLADLKAATVQARADLRAADEAVVKACGEGAQSALRMAIQIYRRAADPAAAFGSAVSTVKAARENTEEALTGANKSLYDLLENVGTSALDAMAENYKAVSNALDAMEAATGAEVEYAQAMTQNFEAQKSALITQIADLRADIEYLKPLVTETLSQVATPDPSTPADSAAEAKSPLLPEASPENSDDNMFMDVILSSSSISQKSQESSESAAHQSSWKVGGWFYSAGHSASSASSSHSKASQSDTSKIEIGFRVAKVNIDRGGWFDPSILKMSNNFYRLADSLVSGGIDKDQIRSAMLRPNTDTELQKLVTYTDASQKKQHYMLPSFPTAFVIAKDITVRVQMEHDEEETNKKYAEEQASSSGGFFGFSASSGGSSKSSSESAYVGSRNNFMYIRIPGPQILGWFQQLVPADQSKPYKAMGGNPFDVKSIMKSLNATESVL